MAISSIMSALNAASLLLDVRQILLSPLSSLPKGQCVCGELILAIILHFPEKGILDLAVG